MSHRSELTLYTRSRVGHRGAYTNFAQSLLGGHVCNRRGAVTNTGPVLFLMADDMFIHYVATALVRALIGRKTVGLLFRPNPALEQKTRTQRAKAFLLKLLKPIPAVKTLTILPFALDPRLETIADGWIHDFQNWDLSEADRHLFEGLKAGKASMPEDAQSLYEEARARAAGRPILVALGLQSEGKGFGHLAAAVAAGETEGWFILVIGRIPKEMAAARATIEAAGGMLREGFASDNELMAGYAAADAVWCNYDPAYDQASGILGRSAQFGVPAIVREGSFSHRFCMAESLPCAAATAGRLNEALTRLPPASAAHGRALTERLRRENLVRLYEYLGMLGSSGAGLASTPRS